MVGYAVLTPFLAAIFAPLFVRFLGHRAAWVLALVPAALVYKFSEFLETVASGGRILESRSWLASLDINYSFLVDGLSLTFGFLIAGIGFFIVIYAGGYLKGHPHLGRFLATLLAFMGSMLGLVFADNLITMFVFWELTSITSFILIGFDHERMAARRAALQALVITGIGGLVMLAGFILLGLVGGTFELSELMTKGDEIKGHHLYTAIFILVMAGAFTKSAQVPFHSWLPNAMEAPTPVSAYLHSATMVKAGVFLMMRFSPILGGTELWTIVLTVFGGATLIAGTILAVRDTDMKLMLAYTTVASLGLLTMLIGVGSEKAIEGAVLYLIAHSFFKGALFMVVGTVDHSSGTRQITKLGGLKSAMPITTFAALFAAISMCGLPPFLGFLAKESIYHSLTHGGAFEWLVAFVAVIGNALMFAVAASIAIKPFWGRWMDPPKAVHEGSLMLWLGPLMLSIAGIVATLGALHLMQTNFFAPMTSAIAGKPVTLDLHLWAGFNLALMLSIVTIIIGVLIYLGIDQARAVFDDWLNFIGWGPDRGFDQFISFLTGFAQKFTDGLQRGEMQGYMRATFIMTGAALLYPMFAFGIWPDIPKFPNLELREIGVMVILSIGIIQVLLARSRLTAVISLGIQGFSVALIFMLFGAPDLSFTQFMVETLSVVIIALVLTRLHLWQVDRRTQVDALFDGVIALSVGAGIATLLLIVTQQTLDMRLSEFFAEYSASIAHGRNIVNVILVDFRALDTLGEITVVLIAGVAALALIRVRSRGNDRETATPSDQVGEV